VRTPHRDPETVVIQSGAPPTAHSNPLIMVASPINRVDDLSMTLSLPSINVGFNITLREYLAKPRMKQTRGSTSGQEAPISLPPLCLGRRSFDFPPEPNHTYESLGQISYPSTLQTGPCCRKPLSSRQPHRRVTRWLQPVKSQTADAGRQTRLCWLNLPDPGGSGRTLRG
jgi:hypothetical protein